VTRGVYYGVKFKNEFTFNRKGDLALFFFMYFELLTIITTTYTTNLNGLNLAMQNVCQTIWQLSCKCKLYYQRIF